MTSSSFNALEDIQALCKDFRRRLKRGDRRRIDDYLPQIAGASQEILFQNLLVIDLEFRRRSGDEPTSQEYIQRFPQFGRLIRQAFYESTLMSMDADVETPPAEETIVLGVPAARKLGEYELLRELGRGGFGVVYAAKHLQRGEVVALKTLPMGLAGSSHGADDAERLHKFRQEFRQLSDVNQPNLVGMQTLEVEGHQWFLTMDLIEGVDFLEYVRPNDQLDESQLRSALKQLVAGIVALHERGIVHRDLKPSNVLVSKDGRVTILDFGLVAELQQPTGRTVSMQSQNFAGTPRYAAPEQAAGTRSAAGDWYALGVMLYEAFTGEAPYSGTGMQMILKKQTEDAPQLADRAGVPEDLATLVDQLLQREPKARPDAATICEVVGVEDETISYGAGDDSESHASTLNEIVLVGREKQLAELAAAKREFLEASQPFVVFIRGRSGEGKTSLIENFLHPMRRGNTLLVLSGRCYDRESVPFKAIDSIIDALVPCLRSRSADEVAKLLPDDTPFLAQLFPVLRRVPAIADHSTLHLAGLDGRQIRNRAFVALRELLRTISQTTPLVIFIDDLQWGDAESAGALRELLTSSDGPRVLVLGSYRSDEADDSPFLKEWRSSTSTLRERCLEVSPLTQQDALLMLASRVGATPALSEEQLGSLLEATRGNPYFIEQLVEGWDAEAKEFRATSLPEIIERKLSRLPREAASLLDTIAVAGQAVAMEEAAVITPQAAQTFATITRMRSERLVRLVGSGEQQLVDTYHDKIRETVLDGMEFSERRKLHVRFGHFLEQAEGLVASEVLDYFRQNAEEESTDPPAGDGVFDIAYHYHAAGDDRGFAYQLLAGELSHRAYASEDAIQFLERALQSMPEHCSDSIRHRVHARLGTAHFRQKSFGPALEHLHRAIELAPSPLQKARALVDIGAIHATRAEFSKAVAYHDEALAELGCARPQGIAIGPKLLALIGRIYLLPRTRWDKQAKSAADGEALKQWIYGSLTWVIFENSVAEYVHAIFRVAAFAVSSRDPTRFAHGISMVIGMLAQIGIPAGLGRYLREAGSITDEMDDAELLGTYYLTLAMVHNAKSELALADEACRRATPLLEKAGVPWVVFAHHLRRHIQQVIGTASAEIEAGNNVLSVAEASGDIRAQCWGNYDIASGLARAGELDRAKLRIDRAREFLNASEPIPVTESVFHCTEGYVLLQASDYEAARCTLEHAWQLCKRSLSFTEFNVRSLPQLIESVVGPDWTTAACSERPFLKRLLRESRLALWVHGNLHSPIHRARGRAFYALGKRRRALRSFERAVRCAERLGADYDRARALLDLAAIEEGDRDQRRREAISLLKQQESVIPYAERWLLGDQYDEQVVAPSPDATLNR